MKLIGLTGAIGSGKSTVASIFRTLNIPVYESDSSARSMMNSDPALMASIRSLLGSDAYLSTGELNRPWIAARVFADPTLLRQLNGIVHPAVAMDFTRWVALESNQFAPYLIKESAILLEEDLTKHLHAVILVVAPESVRIERVMKRDMVTREQVLDRIKNQWTDDKKIPLADYIIYNDGARSLIEQVWDIDKMIKAMDLERAG